MKNKDIDCYCVFCFNRLSMYFTSKTNARSFEFGKIFVCSDDNHVIGVIRSASVDPSCRHK